MIKKIKKVYRELLRIKINYRNRKRLQNRTCSIISSNCIGGVILHELGLQFLTPTVNMYFGAPDFIKFVYNLEYYTNFELVEIDSQEPYPLALCDDIVLHLVHYHSFNEANKKWKERCKRINFNNLYFIMADRDGCTEAERLKFDSLPYKHKAFLTYTERSEMQSSVCIPGTQDGDAIMDICQYKSRFVGERWLDDFDYVSFLNKR